VGRTKRRKDQDESKAIEAMEKEFAFNSWCEMRIFQ